MELIIIKRTIKNIMKTVTGTVIKVTHIGEDYGKVEVTFPSGEVVEYEIARGLALVLSKVE